VKRPGDLRLLVLALLLLAIPIVYFLWNSRSVRDRRETTLKGVPQFPAPHQPPRRKPFPVTPPAATKAAPPSAGKQDAMTSFVLGAAAGAALIQVNALYNTPLFDHLRRCLPEQFRALDAKGRALGVDFAYDVDRIGLSPDGAAMSGFFEGKKVAQSLMGPGGASETYRGGTIFTRNGQCAAQLGNLVVSSAQQGGDCRALVDRALAPTPANAADQLYGDVFVRSDLSDLRDGETPPELRALADGLLGVTVRANVWDSVAVTVEAVPRSGRSPADLAQIAQGALALIRGQLGEDDVELRALADLAKVTTSGGKLELELALPARDLFERFQIPCPGR